MCLLRQDRLAGLDAVFHPRRVALVGASDQPDSTGELFWRNLSSFPVSWWQ